MRYKVILNIHQNQLCITTADINHENTVELVGVDIEPTKTNISIAFTLCKMFCIGYIHGNTGVKVINNINEFQT